MLPSNDMKPARAMPRWVPLLLLFGLLPLAIHYLQEPAACVVMQGQRDTPVVMYSTNWCPYCAKARAYFRRCEIRFVEYDIEASAQNRVQFQALNGRGIPLIMIGDKRLDGFSVRSFEALSK
jgi:glutaredoxin